ncbi:MAG TPA: prepilin-type N-terminal cleavage/methylation domain-containing protein [Planctomycetes bacterium]|nr:prepilin-type N-terminal cleavage/methylation domain-containing protein [Planctomycetota bacterium]
MKRAFTLTEVVIVAAIIGILAAIVIPEFQTYAQQAKEAAAKDNLRILRTAIERYAAEHNGIPPGYIDNDPTRLAVSPGTGPGWTGQLVKNGEYLSKLPDNPFNSKWETLFIENGEIFPADPVSIDIYGWMYQPATKTIRLNWPGSDSNGTAYFDY